MTKQHNKYSTEYNTELKRLSLILDTPETDDTKKKSKQLTTLLKERSDLATEQKTKSDKIRKLTTERQQLLNIASYTREAEREETRLNANSTTHNPRMKNFLGTGTGTKWKTNGWLTNATNHFTPSSGTLNNLYRIKINSQEIETTEEQIISTIAYVVHALKKVDATDFTAKYNTKESDTSKQTKVKDYLTRIQQQEIIVGSGKSEVKTYDFASTYQKYEKSSNTWIAYSSSAFNYTEFFDFVELTHNQSFLSDLDSDKQKSVPAASSWQISLKGEAYSPEQLKDYGLNIDPSKTTLYKTGTDQRTIAAGAGIGGWLNLAHSFTYSDDNKTKLTAAFSNSPTQQLLTDLATWTTDNGSMSNGTNFTLPESLPSLQELKDQLEMRKIGASVKLIELEKNMDDKTKERNDKQGEITVKETAIDTLITEIITKKREKLTPYNITKGFSKTTSEDNRRKETELWQIQHLLLEIRYLENNGDATAPSSDTAENTSLTEIDTILEKLGYGKQSFGEANLEAFLVNVFNHLTLKKGGGKDDQQAITRIKVGKYIQDDCQEEDISIYGSLEEFKTHFENKEKLVKLAEWEIESKQVIEKAINKDDNAQEHLTDWQSKLKVLDPTLDDTIITESWKTKWGSVAKHGKIAEVEKLIKEIIGTDKKVKPEFLEAIKKSDSTLVDLKTLLQKEPKEIITYIALFTYNNLDDSAKEEKNKQKTQMKRRLAKALGKSKESEITPNEIKEALYKVRVGELSIDNKFYTADLKEITTQSPESNEENKGLIAWLNERYWWPVWASFLAGAGLVMIFWKNIRDWWNSSEEQSVERKVEDEEEIKEE